MTINIIFPRFDYFCLIIDCLSGSCPGLVSSWMKFEDMAENLVVIYEAKLYSKKLELILIRSMARLKISLFGALLKLKRCPIT